MRGAELASCSGCGVLTASRVGDTSERNIKIGVIIILLGLDYYGVELL